MLTEDTLCLTEEGWKNCREVTLGDKIYTFDVNQLCFHLEPVEEILVYPWHGYLLKIGDFLAPPDHSFVVGGHYGVFFFSKAKQVYGNSHDIRLNAGLAVPVVKEGKEQPIDVEVVPIASLRTVEVFYKGRVWAPVTASKTFIARRAGHMLITGI